MASPHLQELSWSELLEYLSAAHVFVYVQERTHILGTSLIHFSIFCLS